MAASHDHGELQGRQYFVMEEKMPLSDDFDELWRSFEGVSRLKSALRDEAQQYLFDRLVSATHHQGWDWWTVKSAHEGPVRVGRNNDLENGTASVLANVDARDDQLLIKLNKRVSEADESWQPLDEALVTRFESEEFAAAFRNEQQVGRSGRWPADYCRYKEFPAMSDRHLSLNQILFGPPGTGKTHGTVNAALEILDADYLEAHQGDRAALKLRFDELAERGQVSFVTFHQSFSYEDFVEGLRATQVEGQLQYDVEPGLFKRLCDRASSGRSETNDPFDQALKRLQEKAAANDGQLKMQTIQGNPFDATYFGGETLKAFPQSSQSTGKGHRANLKLVRQYYETGDKGDIYNASYVKGVLLYLEEECGLPPYQAPSADPAKREKFVLIIDEINRGNVSRIFGELISLIEGGKRAEANEALSVILPYSKEHFSVPGNVYLIGTMNTADRSLAGLDIALRRRFVFREMPPRPELLDQVVVGGINIGELLRILNQRIEVLLDREHCLGHAYFMPLEKEPELSRLALIFRHQILPLLQEYFFEDWQRIQWVLNDHRKKAADRFVYQPRQNVHGLFGESVSLPAHHLPWRLNDDAFERLTAYASIIHGAGIATGQDPVSEADVT
ncbi:McrB family protein [Larsenimonas rhizosphaerae]|uniref:McrB family protein n=1 Tax=Larsenimonas rhizosphaerae TaxID=2944682 RepID=UPI002033FBF7|nr:AAA family ATPase [Larsenimonas rhizosphaerae]MCM2130210.1 AAA family ATPase [Larsenimonas rhizosphaerae]